MRRIAIKLVLLGILVLLANEAFRRFLPTPIAWADPVVQAKLRHLKGHGYDTLFIGSSRTYRQVIPRAFDGATAPRRRSFNLGGPAYQFPQTHRLLTHLLDRGRVEGLRYVVLEFDGALDWPPEQNMHTRQTTYWYEWPYFVRSVRGVLASDFGPREQLRLIRRQALTWFEHLFSIGTGVDRVRLGLARLGVHRGAPRDIHDDEQRGYRSLDEELRLSRHASLAQRRQALLDDPESLMRRTRGSREALDAALKGAEPNRVLLGMYRELLALADRRGVELLFLMQPRRGDGYRLLSPAFRQLPEERRIDLSDPDRFPELYAIDMSFDVGHLNHEGSQHLTRYLTEAFNVCQQALERAHHPSLRSDAEPFRLFARLARKARRGPRPPLARGTGSLEP